MNYTRSLKLDGSPDAAILSVLTTLTNNGFQIRKRGDRSASLSGPGLNSTKQNPLLGASEVGVIVEGDQIRLDAELGGMERMQRFVTRFPFLLSFGLALFFIALLAIYSLVLPIGFGPAGRFGPAAGIGWSSCLSIIALVMLPALPWIVISPWMSRHIERRTLTALDTLLGNAQHAR